jgi:hypothetical protein
LFAVTFYRRHLLVCRYAYVLAVRLIRLFVKGICLFGLFASLIARYLLSTTLFFFILVLGVYACSVAELAQNVWGAATEFKFFY